MSEHCWVFAARLELILISTAGVGRQSILTEAECQAYIAAQSKTAYFDSGEQYGVGSWPSDCLGCVEALSYQSFLHMVRFNTDPNPHCTTTWKSVCKTTFGLLDCSPGQELACHVCEAGKFQPLNEESCENCPAGTYADETGTAMNCKSCPDGKTSDTGAASCNHLTGTYWIAVLCITILVASALMICLIVRLMMGAHFDQRTRVAEVTMISHMIVASGLFSTAIMAITLFKSLTKVAMSIS